MDHRSSDVELSPSSPMPRVVCRPNCRFQICQCHVPSEKPACNTPAGRSLKRTPIRRQGESSSRVAPGCEAPPPKKKPGQTQFPGSTLEQGERISARYPISARASFPHGSRVWTCHPRKMWPFVSRKILDTAEKKTRKRTLSLSSCVVSPPGHRVVTMLYLLRGRGKKKGDRCSRETFVER